MAAWAGSTLYQEGYVARALACLFKALRQWPNLQNLPECLLWLELGARGLWVLSTLQGVHDTSYQAPDPKSLGSNPSEALMCCWFQTKCLPY